MKKIKYWDNEQGDYTISEDNKECSPIYAIVEMPTVAALLCDSFNHHQSVTSLKEELIDMTVKFKQLLNAHEEYEELLGEELGELTVMAANRGWKSGRIEKGKEARAKIQEAKDQLK